MKHHSVQFQIDQLRQDKIILAVESIAVMVFALFVSAFLPQLLIRYVYANQQLFEQPRALEYIPLIAFFVGTIYFIYATVMMVMKAIKINKLQTEMTFMADECSCGGDCGCGDHDDNWEELDELDKMVEEAMAESKKDSTASKNVAAAKKSATKTKKGKKSASKKK